MNPVASVLDPPVEDLRDDLRVLVPVELEEAGLQSQWSGERGSVRSENANLEAAALEAESRGAVSYTHLTLPTSDLV